MRSKNSRAVGVAFVGFISALLLLFRFATNQPASLATVIASNSSVPSFANTKSTNNTADTESTSSESGSEASASTRDPNEGDGACTLAVNAESPAFDHTAADAARVKAADYGLSLVEACIPPALHDEVKALLLLSKATAEHNLPQGDSQTDLNEAINLFTRCEVESSESRESAQCQSVQEDAIKIKVAWEMTK